MYYSRWKIGFYALPIVIGLLIGLPNLLSRQQLEALPSWVPKTQVSLGLDLRGGSHLLLEIDKAALVRAREEALADQVTQVLREARIPSSELTVEGDAVVATIHDRDRLDEAAAKIRSAVAPIASDLSNPGAFGIQVMASSGRILLKPSGAAITAWTNEALEQSLEVVRRRVDETGVVEPTIMRQGSDRLLVQLPGVQDPGRIKALLGTTAKMSFHLLDDSARAQRGARLPAGVELLPGADRSSGELYAVRRRAILQGDRLIHAAASFDQQTSEPAVTFRFDSQGAQRFAEITRANVGKPFAIVLDGKVLSAPIIREPITGGSGQISGGFTARSANDLAVMLRAGALPAPLKIIEERTVGPDLGGDAIKMGLITGALGFGLVFAFMVVLYGAWAWSRIWLWR